VTKTRILHITPHLGGGVGKAVSCLVAQAEQAGSPHEHVIACLERPEKSQFSDRVEASGGRLVIEPGRTRLHEEMAAADIVQLEFWNHPATVDILCATSLPPMRLLVWCHVSGLGYPAIPAGLMVAAHRFLFTSECSYEATEVKSLPAPVQERLAVLSSGCGLDDMPQRRQWSSGRLRAGYLGSLNFSKLHPDFVSYAHAAACGQDITVNMIGDETNRAELEQQCMALAQPGLLSFLGYTADVASELEQLDVLLYLLNPHHYGTAENALLEAMAMGVVPVVLDNAAERHIVQHGVTGFVVRTPEEVAAAFAYLDTFPDKRIEMGRQAAAAVRERYNQDWMERGFAAHYAALLTQAKEEIAFRPIFGSEPVDWFRSFHRDAAQFMDDGTVLLPNGMARYGLFERTKGSVFHFLQHFPQDPLLARWAEALSRHARVDRDV
jgi:glycosyltransferase involved in cell wall biosynthesis